MYICIWSAHTTPSMISTPYLVKSFFLIFQGFFSYISQMNEPRGWTFLCIWYENRGVGVYEVERLLFPLYMALCMPLLLRQRTSRVYQDHPHLFGVLTSFVPPVHIQGVSLAPLQGLALWNIFLLTTGSFFFSITDRFCMIPSPAPLRWTFFWIVPHTFQLSCHSWIQPSINTFESSTQL